MSNGPLPSTLTLLSSLPSFEFGDKVRFLGWYVDPCLLTVSDHVFPPLLNKPQRHFILSGIGRADTAPQLAKDV